MKPSPPKLFLRFFRWYANPKLRDHIEGDMIEEYNERLLASGKRKADIKFIKDVIFLFRPKIIRPMEGTKRLNPYGMYKSYLKIGWRDLISGKGYSVINIGGLALGMVVAMFIALWIWDEVSFNKYHDNYNDIAQVKSGSVNPQSGAIAVDGSGAMQFPVGMTLRNSYPQYFKHVVMAWWLQSFTITFGDEKFNRRGEFMDPAGIEMLSLKMIKGSDKSLDNPNSIILSQSTARAIFGNEDPLGKALKIDNRIEVAVTGVYEDIPRNNRFSEAQFFSPWSLWVSANPWLKGNENNWGNRNINIYVQLQPGVSAEEVNRVMEKLYVQSMPADFWSAVKENKPFVQVVPMSTWHLYSEFENGKPAGGRIAFVWLFGIIACFVLLLACINFVNLSTARAERRAREVGVRKALGSRGAQLVAQFMCESFLIVTIAFVVCVLAVSLLQSWFNALADKDIALPFGEPVFWTFAFGFVALTGFLAGLYPSFYLSSFQPAKVLKGVLRPGREIALPRKILVVVQFTVSMILIIGTLVVYQQVEYARNRPVGFNREGLITVRTSDPAFYEKREAIKTELMNSGVVASVTTTGSPLTELWNAASGYQWPGKKPDAESDFVVFQVSHDFGKTVGWEIVAGRDFSREFATDSADALIINESAVKYMGLTNPIGMEITSADEFGNKLWTKKIIGVVKDMVMGSPYEPVLQTLFYFDNNAYNLLHIRIDPTISFAEAIPRVSEVFKRVAPSILFDFKFVDSEHERKFNQEQRIGQLAGTFSFLAILISCLGLFGLALFVAGKRTKEIGIRKVMGASVVNLWGMLSREFVVLVGISCVIAIPVAIYFMRGWLQKYAYRTEISWWIILLTCAVALIITILTVSYQAVKAAMMNPVESLRSE
jgi:putative ABC transport system permease protein